MTPFHANLFFFIFSQIKQNDTHKKHFIIIKTLYHYIQLISNRSHFNYLKSLQTSKKEKLHPPPHWKLNGIFSTLYVIIIGDGVRHKRCLANDSYQYGYW